MTAPQPHPPSSPPFTPHAERAFWAARQEWAAAGQARLPNPDRVTLLTDTVWNHGYPPAYRHAYAQVIDHMHAAATTAAATNPGAWPALDRLAAAAQAAAVAREAGPRPLVPPADRQNLSDAQLALIPLLGPVTPAQAAQPWRPVAEVAWAGALRRGAVNGAVEAATDILAGWRSADGHRLAAQAHVDGQPALDWLADQFTAAHRGALAAVTTSALPQPATPSTPPTPEAVALARQDQAPGITAGPVTGTARAARRDDQSAAATRIGPTRTR